MRYGYFMMPMHSPGSDPSVTLQTDLSQIERLDELGFDEAWIGEHFTAEWENIPAPDIFIGAALQRTRAIKLGTGGSCLPNHNPFHLAHRIAMLDNLARGRFFWGIGSGGLSHFTVDEEIDRRALDGLTTANGDILSTLPRYKLQSATTEILNWVAAAGAMGDTPMELITYQPGYRSPAGTGCGCAVGRWLPANSH